MGIGKMFLRFGDPAAMADAFAPYLENGEQLRHVAGGVLQPPSFAKFVFALLGPGALARQTKHYVVGLTDRRFIALRVGVHGYEAREVQVWPLGALPPVKATARQIAIADPVKPFKVNFSGVGVSGHVDECRAISEALTAAAAPAAAPASPTG